MSAVVATARDRRWVWFAAEVMLVVTTISSVLLLGRLFEDDTFISPLLFTALIGHAVLITMRWFGFNLTVSALLSLIAVALGIVATHYSSTAVGVLLPTGDTLAAINADLDVARDAFASLQAPVPPVTGFLVVSSIAFWILAVAADWAAFRLMSPGQALMPAFSALVFVSLLGVEDGRVFMTGRLIVVSILFVLAHRAASRAAQGVWLDSGPARGYGSLMVAGALVATVAVIAGVAGGPTVPGANEAPILEFGDEGRPESSPISVISPLVQIQPRLVDQSNEIMFTVESTEKSYWRIAALDIFDGSLWRSQGKFDSADGGIDVAYPSNLPTTTVDQVFNLSALAVVWAPAAYLPTDISTSRDQAGLNYEAESATFIVDTKEQDISDGLRYRVRSEIPIADPANLNALANSVSPSIDPKYLALPADYSPLARQTAEQLTANEDSHYGKALALQNYFRENFAYDLDVAKGHDIQRLEDFLTVQRGYCEQFAGAFASMARSIGLPSRVATGFTWGDVDPQNPNLYVVRGTHAHAWPEVYIEGAGWLAFEPTPGRGIPNAAHTGVGEAQAPSGAPANAPAEAAQAPAQPIDPLTGEPQASEPIPPPEPTPTPVPPEGATPTEPELVEARADTATGSRSILYFMLALIAAGAWIVLVPLLKRLRARRHLDRLGDDLRRRVTLAWSTVVDHLEASDVAPTATETLLEYQDRVGRELSIIARDFGELTDLTVSAAYGPETPALAAVERAEALATSISTTIDNEQPWLLRGLHELDPRPLLRLKDPVAARAGRLAGGATTIIAPADEPT